jgi:pimeloyl-ACP methyl ester carboxylesterase
MKRVLALVIVLAAAALVLPPLWFAIFPQPKPDLPAPGRRVQVSPAVRVNTIERGEGPTVVLVHGHPGCAYDWSELMAELARRGFHALAYDRVGYGHSDGRNNGDFTVDANAEELLALLDTENLHDAVVVGWSYGGATAIVAARKDPSRISRLVLVGSVGPGIEKQPGPPAFVIEYVMRPSLAWVSRVPPLGKSLRASLVADAFHPDPIADGFLAQLDANFARPHTAYTFRNEGRDLDGRANLDPSRISVPLLIIHGDEDQLVGAAVAEELHRRAPGSELWMIENAGHMLPITHASAIADRIVAFARTNPNALALGQ